MKRRNGWLLAPLPLTHVTPVLVDALAAAGLTLRKFLENAVDADTDSLGLRLVHPLRRQGGKVNLMDAAGVLSRFEVERDADCLDVSMSLGDQAIILTHHAYARLVLRGAVPHTIALAGRGRPLREVIDHPLLLRDEYRICRITGNQQRSLTHVLFMAPMVAVDEETARILDRDCTVQG